ncbi:MAG: YlxR family protein [Firmicutes bacterium]|nr:YlxR family protein [Bacillota bacterium]
MKKIPMRSCVVTLEKLPKKELIRVVRTPEGNVVVDESGKVNGRGAYLKKSIETFEKAKKTKILNKKLEVDVPDSIYEELKSKVGE